MFSEKAEIECSVSGESILAQRHSLEKIYNAYIVRLLHIYFSVFNSILKFFAAVWVF